MKDMMESKEEGSKIRQREAFGHDIDRERKKWVGCISDCSEMLN